MKNLKEAISLFSSFQHHPIRVISHYDADGISSAAIMTKALQRAKVTFALRNIKQLSEDVLKELSEESYALTIFCDLGAGQYPLIKQYIQQPVIILDHHEFDEIAFAKDHLMINPLQDNKDPQSMSGAGVCFLFAKALNEQNKDLAHIAIIGALGDMQTPFIEDNLAFVAIAKKEKQLIVEQAINWYGMESKPLLKLLTSHEPFIPGVSGNESAAMQLLVELQLPAKHGEQWTYYDDLSKEQLQILSSRIIMLRSQEEHPEDIFANRYILAHETPKSPFRDAKEFATLLNACGRLNRASIGIGALLQDEESKQQALSTVLEYRQHIVQALRWYDNHQDQIIKGKNYVIINAKDNVLSTIIGTLASMITSNKSLAPGTLVLSMARNGDNTTKISLRCSGECTEDLREIIGTITSLVGGEAGGHQQAAGALIDTEIEDKFVQGAKKIFENLAE